MCIYTTRTDVERLTQRLIMVWVEYKLADRFVLHRGNKTNIGGYNFVHLFRLTLGDFNDT